jgi:uncharacterized membrane protein YbhN (UPF0104 family)
VTSQRTILKYIAYVILACAVIGILLYNAREIFDIFKEISWWLILTLVLLQIPLIASGGLAFKILCKRFNIDLHWQDWVGLSFIANLVNHLLPYRPGVAFRYMFLQQRYQMKVMDYVYIMLIYGLLMLGISAGFTLIGWLNSTIAHTFNKVIFISFGLFLFILLIILGLKLIKFESGWFNTKFKNLGSDTFHKGMQAMKLLIDNPLILLGSALSLLMLNLITAVIFYLIFKAAGVSLPFTDCVFLVGIATIAMIFPITPGNIGVLETLIGTLTQMMYGNFSIGFSVTALFRATQWIPSIILGTSFSLVLIGSIIPSLKTLKVGANKRVD